MAQSERFYFWVSYRRALMLLSTDEERGRFVRAMCDWAFDGEEPDFDDNPLMCMAWTLVRDQIAESVEIGRSKSEAGRRGGRPRKSTAKSTSKSTAKSTALSTAESTPKSSAESTAESTPKSEGKGKERNGSVFLSLPGKEGGLRAPAVAGATPPVRYDENGVPIDEQGRPLGPSAFPPESVAQPYYGDQVPASVMMGAPIRPSGQDGS